VFAVKLGEVKKRVDVNYFHPRFRSLINKLSARFGDALKTIGDIAEVVCGPFGSDITRKDYVDVGIPLLRITNITKQGTLNYSNLKHISEDCAKKLVHMQVSNGDVVISQRGTLGQCAVVDDTYSACNISANIIAIKNIREVDAEFVRNYILSSIGIALLQRAQSGQVQGKITIQDIKDLPIPVNADMVKLNDIVSAARETYDAKLRKSDDLLRGMDAFLREIMELPKITGNPAMFFAVKNLPKRAGRIDPNFHNPFYQRIVERILKMEHDSLGNIVEFSEETWDQKSDFTDSFPYIEISKVKTKMNEYGIEWTLTLEAPSRAKKIVRDKDIIVSTTRPHRGSIATIKCNKGYYITTTGFCVLRQMKRKDVSREYLQWILSNDYVLQQFLQRSSGGNYPAITPEEMKKVLIPIPSEDIQEKIVEEAIRRKKVACQLRHETEKEWAEAKERFEQELMK